MGLSINTNVAAINTSRVLRRSTEDLNRSLERLSSGLRINRADDDAAGLAIAEEFNNDCLHAKPDSCQRRHVGSRRGECRSADGTAIAPLGPEFGNRIMGWGYHH